MTVSIVLGWLGLGHTKWTHGQLCVGLVAVGVQEQAEDILVPPLLRNCLTLIDISFPSHYLPPQNCGHCNSFPCLGHFENVCDDDDDDDDTGRMTSFVAAR